MAGMTSNTTRVLSECRSNPKISLKSVKPLLPPKPMSFRKNASSKAYVSACVMIDRYTPVTRDLNANHPNTNASTPGTRMTMSMANQNMSKPCQNHGNSFQFRKTMKSGSTGSAYTPRGPTWRMRYMPMA